MADITHFHERYLRVLGASHRAPYVRPFKSRGHGLETFNVNVAGSYAPSSLRARGKLIDVIEVKGENRDVTYSLRPEHPSLVLDRLLKNVKIPVVSLVAFLYRDYGFELEKPDVGSCVTLFREEFGLDQRLPFEQAVFSTIFADDMTEYSDNDLEPVDGKEA
ncbi:hypothetical protein [Devosia equisanguinis]|nr:hypothetical protein [Devosia equisanguinis]